MDVSVTPESDALSNDILRRTIDRIATIVNLGLDKLMSGIIDELTPQTVFLMDSLVSRSACRARIIRVQHLQ